MLFKLLWIVVIFWIGTRVYRAGREILGIATGRDPRIVPPREDPEAPAYVRRKPDISSPPRQNPVRDRDVEDARFEDLS